MSEHTTQAADSALLEYDCRGAGSPLLFLHGLTFDRSTWEPIIDQLADRFTCVAVDLPGHGGSGGSGRDLDEVAHSIRRLLDELGIEDVDPGGPADRAGPHPQLLGPDAALDAGRAAGQD